MAYPFQYYTPPVSQFNAPQSVSSFYPTQTPPAPQMPAGALVCRAVTSRAEAEVFQIPFDGSTTYFVDTSSGNIYAKAFDMNTGTAPLVTYTRETARNVQYATLADLQALRDELTGGKANDE